MGSKSVLILLKNRPAYYAIYLYFKLDFDVDFMNLKYLNTPFNKNNILRQLCVLEFIIREPHIDP